MGGLTNAIPFTRSSLSEDIFPHRNTGRQVLVDDPFEHGRIAFPVPCAFGVHHRDRPLLADPQTIGLAAIDAALLRESQFLEASLEKVPRCETALSFTAFGFRLVGAQEDVPPDDGNAEGFGFAVEFVHRYASAGLRSLNVIVRRWVLFRLLVCSGADSECPCPVFAASPLQLPS
jgi:hypothetical protein